MTKNSRLRCQAFTRLDSAVIVATVCVIVLVALSCSKKHRENVYVTECSYNLRMVHAAYSSFIQERGNWVTGISTNEGGTRELIWDAKASNNHFDAFLSNRISKSILLCPKDLRASNRGAGPLRNAEISYFLSLNVDQQDPKWILAGTRNISKQEGAIIPLSSNAVTKWHAEFGLHGSKGYLTFVDGHVDLAPQTNVPTALLRTTNWIVLP